MKLSVFMILALTTIALLSIGTVNASTLVFDRGLPTINLNDEAGANRSNVSWAEPADEEPTFNGDDFILPTGTWRIDKITIWSVPLPTSDTTHVLSDVYPTVSLYASEVGDTLSFITSNHTDTRVYYDGGYYKGNYDNWQLWQTDFNDINWVVDGGVLYQFGIKADTINDIWYNHASNAALSGSQQDGADNLFRRFNADGTLYDLYDSNQPGIWDKSSDINIRVYATAVPEPMSIILGIMGLGSIAGFRKLRK